LDAFGGEMSESGMRGRGCIEEDNLREEVPSCTSKKVRVARAQTKKG